MHPIHSQRKPFQHKVSLGLILTTFAALALTAMLPARAEVITFDDLSDNGQGTRIPNGYHGFDWNNFYVLNAPLFISQNGYANGTVSAPNVAYNGFGGPAVFMTASSPFTLNSADFTAAWSDGLTVTIQGLDNSNTVINSKSFVVNTSGPTLETFNWSGLSGVSFSSSGGTNHGYLSDGTHFAMDNLTVNAADQLTSNGAASPVPEPSQSASLAFMGLGLGAVVLRARRRKARTH